jgi:hypothetical protein
MSNYLFFVWIVLAVILGLCCAACSAPQTESTPQPTPTVILVTEESETAVSPTTFTETELASQIHQTIIEVSTAIQTSPVSSELQSHIEYTIDLIGIYKTLYADVSVETMGALIEIEAELQQLNAQLAEWEANSNQANALEIQRQSVEWVARVEAHINAREKLYATIPSQPGIVANNRVEAFTQAHDFLDAMNAAFDDDKLSPDELTEIGRLAANAKASFYNTGDHQIFGFAEQIDAIAHHAFRGEWTQARDGMFILKFSLPARPRT